MYHPKILAGALCTIPGYVLVYYGLKFGPKTSLEAVTPTLTTRPRIGLHNSFAVSPKHWADKVRTRSTKTCGLSVPGLVSNEGPLEGVDDVAP